MWGGQTISKSKNLFSPGPYIWWSTKIQKDRKFGQFLQFSHRPSEQCTPFPFTHNVHGLFSTLVELTLCLDEVLTIELYLALLKLWIFQSQIIDTHKRQSQRTWFTFTSEIFGHIHLVSCALTLIFNTVVNLLWNHNERRQNSSLCLALTWWFMPSNLVVL